MNTLYINTFTPQPQTKSESTSFQKKALSPKLSINSKINDSTHFSMNNRRRKVISFLLLSYISWLLFFKPKTNHFPKGIVTGPDGKKFDSQYILTEGQLLKKENRGLVERFILYSDGWEENKFNDYYKIASQQTGIGESWLKAKDLGESHFDKDAKSKAGALGVAQIMPKIAKELNIDPLNPAEAIPAGAQKFNKYYKDFGRIDLAFAAYNGGPTRLRRKIKEFGIEKAISKMPQETQKYLPKNTTFYWLYENPHFRKNVVSNYLPLARETLERLQNRLKTLESKPLKTDTDKKEIKDKIEYITHYKKVVSKGSQLLKS